MNKVIIRTHPETGKLFTETANPNFFKTRLESEEMVVSNGVFTTDKRSCFPVLDKRTVEALSSLKNGDALPISGKIVRTKSFEPQYEGHKPVINSSTKEEMGYYYTFQFTTDLNATDQVIQAGEAITVSEKVVEEQMEA